MKTYTGTCHCKAVRYEAEIELTELLECNCSHCEKKGLLLAFIDNDKFTLIQGKENLTEYFFNKKSIRHLFCKTCGVQSFSEGIAFPKIAINARCLEGVDITTLPRKAFNGKDI